MEHDQLEGPSDEGNREEGSYTSEREKPQRRRTRLIPAAIIVALAILAHAWITTHPRGVSFDQTYQAVLLSNNTVYFGKLQGYGTENPVLTEVYYVQSTVDPQTKEQKNVLTRRGKEWHEPDRMYINPRQIMFVEPVGPNSRVSELIKELKLQR